MERMFCALRGATSPGASVCSWRPAPRGASGASGGRRPDDCGPGAAGGWPLRAGRARRAMAECSRACPGSGCPAPFGKQTPGPSSPCRRCTAALAVASRPLAGRSWMRPKCLLPSGGRRTCSSPCRLPALRRPNIAIRPAPRPWQYAGGPHSEASWTRETESPGCKSRSSAAPPIDWACSPARDRGQSRRQCSGAAEGQRERPVQRTGSCQGCIRHGPNC
mmetsp:Transcript_19162/g.61315  ORF Transcript_19162/g.61315 Transcript_19162/m.61315 type:complete len:220 (-) Transcript_19162:798-1457(-)